MNTTFQAIAGLSLRHVPDEDLLRRFASGGDHAAFELLVWRHRRLVLGVCRRVAGNVHDAEDAFQATFLVLARRAAAVRGANLAGWLSQVAYRCAVRIRKTHRVEYPADLSTIPASEPVIPEPDLAGVLDAELNCLPDKYRIPLVMCYLQGKTYHQIAEELDCAVGTLCGWLARGKSLLRVRLTRRGLALSAGSLAAHLGALTLPASAGDDVIRSITAAVAICTGGDAVPGRVSAVADGVLRMTWKWNMLAVVVATLLLGLTAAAIGLDRPPPTPNWPVPNQPTEKSKTDTERLQGVWLIDAADYGKGEIVDMLWTLPPGEYTLDVIGGGRFGRKSAPFTVPEHKSEFTIPPVVVPVIGLATQPGQPIPELTDIVAWKGKPVKLADLRGKIVFLHFWSYGCGQCIQEMPMLMDLHNAYKDKGLVIVGVHIDAEGEIDSAKALDAKLELFRKDEWRGKDVPFPVALTSGKRLSEDENAADGLLADKFGIRGYPHTLIIGRDGKVIGALYAHDTKQATERVEYLLEQGK